MATTKKKVTLVQLLFPSAKGKKPPAAVASFSNYQCTPPAADAAAIVVAVVDVAPGRRVLSIIVTIIATAVYVFRAN